MCIVYACIRVFLYVKTLNCLFVDQKAADDILAVFVRYSEFCLFVCTCGNFGILPHFACYAKLLSLPLAEYISSVIRKNIMYLGMFLDLG